MTPTPLRPLITETLACLSRACHGHAQAEEMLAVLGPLREVAGQLQDVAPVPPAHEALLDQAVSCIPKAQFPKLKPALVAARDHLHWRVDDGGFYAPGADVGEGYRTGNMHTLLIGPKNAPIRARDMLLGIFLLAPATLYRDHAHAAPELYLPLTGPSGWRFDRGAWEDHPAGALICNAPDRKHATRVYDVPFLAVFAWTRDIHAPCRVVPASDWSGIEAHLRDQHAPRATTSRHQPSKTSSASRSSTAS